MNIDRLEFLKKTALTAGSAVIAPSILTSGSPESRSFDFKISLAEWSHQADLFAGRFDHLDFPSIAKLNYGIDAVEYVNQFFPDKASDISYIREMKRRAEEHGVQSVLIMVDNEGEVSSADDKTRVQAVHNHYKWIGAAKLLGCHAIRINLFGENDPDTWIKTSVDGLGRLAEFASDFEISVIVENHGSHSSHGKRLAEVMSQVNSKWAGTLPDFGNFCVARENGQLWGSECIEQYDVYQGTKELMPYAKGVSAKTFHFDGDGNEKDLDYLRLFKIIKDSGFNGGYVGIEYEGEELYPAEGIMKTKQLLERVRTALS